MSEPVYFTYVADGTAIAVTIPAVFHIAGDLNSERWPEIRKQLIKGVKGILKDAFDEAELMHRTTPPLHGKYWDARDKV